MSAERSLARDYADNPGPATAAATAFTRHAALPERPHCARNADFLITSTVSGLSKAMLKAAWSADGGLSRARAWWFVGIQIGGLCRAAYTNRRRQPCVRSSRLSRSRPMGNMQG